MKKILWLPFVMVFVTTAARAGEPQAPAAAQTVAQEAEAIVPAPETQIVETVPPPVPAVRSQVRESDQPVVFSDARSGMSVTGPDGWLMYQGMRKHPEILAVFSRLPYGAGDADNPKIIVIKEKRGRKGPDSAVAKAYRDAEVLGLMKNLKDIAGTRLIDGPSQDGQHPYSRLLYEISERKKDKTVDSARTCEYVFSREGYFYVLLCGARTDMFDKYAAEFDRTADSVTFR
ncbi:MAG: hypothetical protein ACM3OC_09700 [Deltaproteobacteria bacterium]